MINKNTKTKHFFLFYAKNISITLSHTCFLFFSHDNNLCVKNFCFLFCCLWCAFYSLCFLSLYIFLSLKRFTFFQTKRTKNIFFCFFFAKHHWWMNCDDDDRNRNTCSFFSFKKKIIIIFTCVISSSLFMWITQNDNEYLWWNKNSIFF